MIDDRRIQCPRPLGMPFHPVVCPMLLEQLYSSSKDGVQGKTKTVGRKDGSRKREGFLFVFLYVEFEFISSLLIHLL